MWVAKVTFNGEKGSIGCRTKKYGVVVSGFPISVYENNKGIIVTVAGFVFGDNKNKFLQDWKKDKKVLNIEINNDFILAQIIEPLELRPIYFHKLINIEPIVIDEKGFDNWTIGSWDKEHLMKFIKLVRTKYGANLKSIKQEKINSLSIIGINPNLTQKQKESLEIAIKQGYYSYPREIELEKLAKMKNISYSTYQAHLRKAEQKLIPHFFNNLK